MVDVADRALKAALAGQWKGINRLSLTDVYVGLCTLERSICAIDADNSRGVLLLDGRLKGVGIAAL